jgi:hypothetical protein
MSEEKKTTVVKDKAEIYKVLSINEKRNMQEVIMKEGGDAYYTRHIALDPSKPMRPKRRMPAKRSR